MHPRDEIFFTTTPITITTSDGIGYGTGFFFRFCENYFGTPVPTLITNKHVLRDAQRISFPLNVGDNLALPTYGEFDIVEANIEECAVINHPNANIDLCAILLGPFMEHVKEKRGQQTGLICATPDILATPSEIKLLKPLDSVIMIGYPIGLWDQVNNQPISRRGYLATRPALDFCDRPEFLIDLACVPGSSGSPVFIHDIEPYPVSDDNMIHGKGRTRLIGILYAGPMYDAEGKLYPIPVPTSGVSLITQIPIHLGFVIKASEILKIEKTIIKFLKKII